MAYHSNPILFFHNDPQHWRDCAKQTRTLAEGLRDPEAGWRNLTSMGEVPGLSGLRELCQPLSRILPRCADPDMALNNLERYVRIGTARQNAR